MEVISSPAFEASELLLRVKELEEQQLDLRKSVTCAFNQMLDLKDISTGVHSTRLAEWAVRVAREMNIPENHCYQVEVAALLHDIRLFSGLEQASLYALHHHENADGTGYPAGLKGQDIPLVSRIISVIDAYDAMVSNRAYRAGLPHAEAISRLLKSSGTQFDSQVVQVFIPIAERDTEAVFAAAGTSISAAF
jgi:HD-GYP domain-containing protein (c-di-GMP phosphodiesterase class II)